MAKAQKKKRQIHLDDEPLVVSQHGEFLGYKPLTSSVTYTPNQFFDVSFPYSSAPRVKLVGYMLRRHFGWVDAYGKPQEEQLVIGYADLINAGVPRGHIREAIDEALVGNFINCVRKPRRAEKGKSSISGLYELRFDDNPEYTKDPDAFHGFFDGDGHFTYVPNQFYDVCLREEVFSVTKAVGTVIRFSIGFKVRRGGGRRQLAKVDLTFIANYSNMTRNPTVFERPYIGRLTWTILGLELDNLWTELDRRSLF